MSQFFKTITKVSANDKAKVEKKASQPKELPLLLNFLEKETIKNQQGKCGFISHRNNKKHILRPFKVSQINWEQTKPGSQFGRRNKPQNQNEHHVNAPIFAKMVENQRAFNKENRPSSMNQLKIQHLSKVKTHFCNTERYQSLNQFLVNSQKLNQPLEDPKIFEKKKKKASYNISKSLSRPQLVKVFMRDQKILTEAEQVNESLIKPIQIFHESALSSLLCNFKSSKPLEETSRQNKDEKDLGINFATITDSNLIKSQNSPIKSRIQSLFDVNFSTIKLKEASSSQFLTKQSIDELILPTNQSTIWNEEKIHCQKKRKLQIEKIRKKFPEHFFK